MKILITGGTGMLGTELINRLRFNGSEHELTVYARHYAKASKTLHKSIVVTDNLKELSLKDFDAVINLCGEPIFDKRWSDEQKEIICESRWSVTQQLVEKIDQECDTSRPIRFISGSAVGVYGPQGSQEIDENFVSNANNFASSLCQKWEAIALSAKNANTSVIRTGIVLANHAGALPEMLKPISLGVGGKIGSGNQYMPWIHVKDWVSAVLYLLNEKSLTGPVNLTAPVPVTNKVMTNKLATIVEKPAFLMVPSFMMKLILGERAMLITTGQNVIPKRLLDAGFNFEFSDIGPALEDILLV